MGKQGNDKEAKGKLHIKNRKREKGKCLLEITESKKK
jgi:hypothetical protein